jgi:hypothetical protein
MSSSSTRRIGWRKRGDTSGRPDNVRDNHATRQELSLAGPGEPATRTGVLVNSVCPGWVSTDMGGRGGRLVYDGAASVVWAAMLPDNGPTGGFFRNGRPLAW